MIIDRWLEEVSSDRPVDFDADGGRLFLDLRSCVLAPGGGAAPTRLICHVEGAAPMTVAIASPQAAVARVRVRVRSNCRLSCSGGGRLLVSGLLLPGRPAGKRPAAPAVGAVPAKRATVGGGDATSAAAASTVAKKPPAIIEAEIVKAAPASKASAAKPPAQVAAKAAAPVAASDVALKESTKRRRRAAAAKARAAAAAEAAGGAKAAAAEDSNGEAVKKGKGSKEKPVKPVNMRTLTSGVKYQVLKLGSGVAAESGKLVNMKYEGFLTSGKRFDKGAFKFRLGLGEVIAGLDEGVKGMLTGEERRILVPPRLGYGTQGSPPVIPPNSPLVFEVKLLG